MAQSLRRWGDLSIPTPELPASASGIGMGRLTCYAWHAPCVTACHPATRATLIAHSSPPRLCTYADVMPSSPMLKGGSNHHEGSNGIELYMNDIWVKIKVCNDDMTVVGDGLPLRLHKWAVRITISITLRRSEARCSSHRYCPSAHPVSSIGTPRHPNHRPSCTSALDADE